jgi:hypothetical protein
MTKSKLKVGDRVAYSRAFCQDTGQQTGDIPFARGVIESFESIGETALAIINWNDPNIPEKVNVKNLVNMNLGDTSI